MVKKLRLIDADALIKSICGENCGCNFEDCGLDTSEGVMCICHRIKIEPSVEAVPVRHAHWEKVPVNDFLVCSYCHDCYIEPDWIGYEGNNPTWIYCPKCGSYMREKE